jgi:hypothetical protein
MIKFLVKMGLGLVGGAVAGPLAPLGGAAGYALGEFVFDEEKEYLDPEELAEKYAIKLLILTVGGAVGGFAGEALGSSFGAGIDGITEMIVPGDVSEKVANLLLSNETVANLFHELCNLTADSCLSEEAKTDLMKTYFDKFEDVINLLIIDGIMEETIGREIVKSKAKEYTQNLLEALIFCGDLIPT